MTGFGLGLVRRLLKGPVVSQNSGDRPHAMRPHDRQIRFKPLPQEPLNLVHGSIVDHRVEPPVDLFMKRRPFRREDELQAFIGRQDSGSLFLLPNGEGLAGCVPHLQCPHDPLGIAWPQPFGHDWVAIAEDFMQCAGIRLSRRLPPALPDIARNFRYRRQSLEQCLKIHAGATDDDRQMALRLLLRDDFDHVRTPKTDIVGNGAGNGSVETMRRTCDLFIIRPRRQNAQVFINLHGIRIDHAATQPFRQGKRHPRLAACGRPCNKDGANSVHIF